MGWTDIFRRRRSDSRLVATSTQRAASGPASAAPSTSADGSWYVPQDGDAGRFVAPAGGMPPLHLIEYRDSGGEQVLRLCEDATGLLVGPTDRRLVRAGIFVSQLRGETYHKSACRRGDFSPGTPVRLRQEPNNEYDPFAVAVTADENGAAVAAYVNKQKARAMSKLLDQGTELAAVSLRGTGAGTACEQIAVLAARPDVLAHLLSPRPRHLPRSAHQR
jgi:hypothetical protein